MSTVVEVPQPQYMAALGRANAIRFAAATLRREVASGVVSFEAALVDERAGSLRVPSLVASVPGLGPKTASRALRIAGIGVADKRVRSLTERQRTVLVECVRVAKRSGSAVRRSA